MDLWTPAKICEIWTLQGCGAPWHKIAPNRISKWVWLRSKNHNRCLTFVASAFSWQPGGHEEARQRARHCCGSVINSVHLHLVHYAWSTGTDQLNTTLAIEHKTHPVRQRRLFTGGLAMKISQEGFLRMFSGRPGAVLSVPLDRVITRHSLPTEEPIAGVLQPSSICFSMLPAEALVRRYGRLLSSDNPLPLTGFCNGDPRRPPY